ncbi:protein FAR1-RELATED SEQUENCE 7-like [Rosa rugosa]|uniref:protein FAR1-RELATED SEQUENCE 7-like n=1 Tax=Rosa rugosa TaxID=74645 RepID=UPI002B40122E|nr:protein FAR1-RELATED SEQUENCE 7-like [Rosa rugosa]
MDSMDEEGLRFSDYKYHKQVFSDEDKDAPLGFESFADRFGEVPFRETMPPNRPIASEAEMEMNGCSQFKKVVPDLAAEFGNVELNGRNFKDITFEDVKHLWFRTIDEAEKFYKYYSHMHNHDLVIVPEVHFLRSHRKVEGHDIAQGLYNKLRPKILKNGDEGDAEMATVNTRRTGIARKPMVLFVRCNNHRGTVVFGVALVVDEKEEIYDWLFNQFIESMQQKRPLSVLTDGDEAMKNAMERVMPQTRQRLCAWHIGRNIGQNLNSEEVKKAIGQLMFASLTVAEWESAWQSVILKFGLQNNAWVCSLYKKRDRWAEAYFRGHFFGGMCSTQRCEGMNCQFKKQISRYTKLSDVMPRLEWKLNRLRDRVMRDNFNVKNTTPVFDTHMRGLEEQACKIFTHDIFIMIKSQIRFEGRFVVHKRFKFPNVDAIVFYLGQYDRVERLWCVEYRGNNGNPEWLCSCKMYESDDIPCAHLFSVMKAELVSEFPNCLILKRWTRSVGETTIAPLLSHVK